MAGRSRLSPVCDMGSYSSSCGYCGGSDGSCAHGMQCPSLTVYAYQGGPRAPGSGFGGALPPAIQPGFTRLAVGHSPNWVPPIRTCRPY